MVKKEIRWCEEEREGIRREICGHWGVALEAGTGDLQACLRRWGMCNIGRGRKEKMLARMVI